MIQTVAEYWISGIEGILNHSCGCSSEMVSSWCERAVRIPWGHGAKLPVLRDRPYRGEDTSIIFLIYCYGRKQVPYRFLWLKALILVLLNIIDIVSWVRTWSPRVIGKNSQGQPSSRVAPFCFSSQQRQQKLPSLPTLPGTHSLNSLPNLIP